MLHKCSTGPANPASHAASGSIPSQTQKASNPHIDAAPRLPGRNHSAAS
jgi:hypothetical protein